ncbi:MAG: copper ion binding protein, partial [Anaerolineae bacterium]
MNTETKSEVAVGKEKLSIPVRGMTCASCVAHVEKALRGVEGVGEVNVNLATEKASLDFKTDGLKAGDLVKAVQETGYEVPTETTTLDIEGMTCASCVNHVEQALSKVPGVVDVAVNLATERATVTYVTEATGLADFRKAVREAGYQVAERQEGTPAGEEEAHEAEVVRKMRQARFRMRTAWLFTAPIIVWMLAEMLLGITWPNETAFNLGMIVLALPVLFWVGRRTFQSGLTAVLHGYANMDTLITLGTWASLLTGPASFFFPVANYAGVSAMIMAFHLTGRYIEESAMGRASQAIRKLLELGAKTARIARDGEEVEIPVDEVRVGDVMVV